MKRIPTRIFWELIGDFFTCTILDNRRRSVEGFWQGMSDQAAEALEYTKYYQDAKSVFRVEPFAPYGTFPADVNLVDVESSTEGLLIGKRNGRYLIYSDDPLSSETGSFRVGSVTYSYSSGSSSELMSGGSILSLATAGSVQPANNPSSLFQRFEHLGSRDSFDLDWVNVAIFQDTEFMDGAQDWRQVYRLNIDNWEATSNLRVLSFNSFGDTGPSYEARLTDDGTNISVSFGQFATTKNRDLQFSGNLITRFHDTWGNDGFEVGQNITISGTSLNDGTYTVTSVSATELGILQTFSNEFSTNALIVNNLEPGTGSSSSWKSGFSGSIEFEISYDSENSTITGSIFYDGNEVAQSTPYSVSAGRRKNSISLINQQNNVKLTPDLLVSTGKIWGEEALDYTTDIGTEFSYIYAVEEPLINASEMRTEPWPLKQKLEVLSQSSTSIAVEEDEDFAGYIPLYAKLTNADGTFSTAKYEDGVYKPISYVLLDSEVTVEPWSTTDIIFESKSRFRTKIKIPQKRMWFIDTRAVELDMYERYGRELRMPSRDDSQEYLNALRGMQYGLLKPATPKNFENAIGVMSSIPYSTQSGVISSIELVTNVLGKPIRYDVNINGVNIPVKPYWRSFLKPVGSSIGFLETLVRGVEIYDWKSDPELMRARFGPWAQWGGFVVQIPSFVGINETVFSDINRLLNRSKSIHSNFIIEYKANISEDLPNEIGRARAYERTSSKAENIAVITDNISFTPSDHVIQKLDEGRLLDTNHYLDGENVVASGYSSSLIFVDRPQNTNRPWVNSLVDSGMRYSNVESSRSMYVVGDSDRIFFTKNLGKTWTQETVNSGSGGSFTHVSRGVASQNSNFVWVRDNKIWDRYAAPFQVDFVVGDLPEIMIIEAATGNYAISRDSGLTWETTQTLPNIGIRDVVSYGLFNIGYIGNQDVRNSLDGGQTWVSLASGTNPVSTKHLAYDITGNERGFGSLPAAAYELRGWLMVSAKTLSRLDYVASTGALDFIFPNDVRHLSTGRRGVIAITTAGVWTR